MNTLGTRSEPLPARRRLRLVLLITGTVVVALTAAMVWRMGSAPAALDLSTRRATDNGLFAVAYEPAESVIPINQLHTWTLTVTSADRRVVADAEITVDGTMPEHGHGLATQPQVTEYLGDGRYLARGLKFQMGGRWVVDVSVTAGGQTDAARFNLALK